MASADSPETLFRERIATAGEQGYRHVLDRIATLVGTASRETGLAPDRIGIGTPGTLDPDTGLLRGCNSQHLQHQPFRTDLETLLGVPVVVENDANCFALAETRLGVVPSLGLPVSTVFGIILGTGVGGGLVIDGNLTDGPNRIRGEWGHNHLDDSGGVCWCGRTGCVETILSGPALERYYADAAGQSLALAEIAKAAGQDPVATRAMERLVTFFGRGIAGVINLLDPDVIVIGGGVGNIDRLYTDGVAAIHHRLFSPSLKTRIVKPLLGDSAGVIGAALL